MAAPDFGKLTSTLNRSGINKDNPALYQTIANLIKALQDVAGLINTDTVTLEDVQEALQSARALRVIEPNTLTGPQARNLTDDVSLTKFVVYKDYQGNAAANNITLTGTVDGVVNPVINTNFGVFRVYKSSKDGLFHEW